jgi:hypothetical protein
MLNERKQLQKNLFVGRLTMNNEMVDENLALKLINDYAKYCYEDSKKFVIDEFKEKIEKISD